MKMQMADMTIEQAAAFLRQAAETTARMSQNWPNFEAICADFLRSAYGAGKSAASPEPSPAAPLPQEGE
jgi:hypothetical protein